MNLRLMFVIAGALLLGAAGTLLLVRNKPLAVEWTIASNGETAGAIIAPGHVVQGGVTPVYAAVPGTIGMVNVIEGESVVAGDTLVHLDDREVRARRERCALDVTIATLRLEEHLSKDICFAREKAVMAAALESLAVRQGMRSDSLFLQGTISRAELDEIKIARTVKQSERVIAETELAAASSTGSGLLRAELSQAVLALDEAELMLARTVVTAPAGGQIEGLSARIGDRAIPGQPLLEIVADEPSVAVNVKVSGFDLPCLQVGRKARVAIGPEVVVDAVVKSIAGRVDTATGLANVVLSVKKTEHLSPFGRMVIARIATESTSGTILLDRRFLFGTEHFRYVWVKSGDRVLRRGVRSAVIADDIVSIYGGLAQGDTVVGAAGLTEASPLRLARRPVGNVKIPAF